MAKSNRWNELCRLVEVDDGLPIRKVGSWTVDKLWFWHNYVEITTAAMVDSPKWKGGVCYVDLFAGPGVCVLRETGERVPGSALIAAYSKKPFSRIVACELEPKYADACRTRLESSPASACVEVLVGDCNKRIHDVVGRLPPDALTLAFVDPPGLDAHYETIRVLSESARADLLLLFADSVDALRNAGLYEKQSESRLDLALGPNSDWRSRRDELVRSDAVRFCNLLVEIYESQLQKLGYCHFREHVMKAGNLPIYKLVYASKHSRGLDFWDKATRKERRGQGRLF